MPSFPNFITAEVGQEDTVLEKIDGKQQLHKVLKMLMSLYALCIRDTEKEQRVVNMERNGFIICMASLFICSYFTISFKVTAHLGS